MRKILTSISENSIKALLVVKLVVIAGVVVSEQGWLGFGEKSVQAEDAPAAKGEHKPETGDKRSAAVTAQPADEAVTPQRKSFLHDLLNLPELNTEEPKKEEIARYLSLVEKKKSQVEDRLSMLQKREEQLKGIEGTIEEKMKKLEEEILFLQQTLQKEKQLADDRLESLVEFYNKMAPKKAAPVFEKMDKDLVVALFNKIPKKQTTQILQLMNPEKSVELTEYYGRIRSGKEYEMLREINVALRKEFESCKGMP